MLNHDDCRKIVNRIRAKDDLGFRLRYSPVHGINIGLHTVIRPKDILKIKTPSELIERIETEIAIYKMMQ